ncbi:MAG: caspase family protein [Clostridia bacterium]|nr:caspase family protein [Clostridia bacterium]
MGKRLFALVFVWLCLLAPSALADASVNRALLVGCDRFVTQEDTTPSSENNVTQMAEALSGGAMNLETLITRKNDVDSPAELEELIQAAFAQADENDVSYFYISTHGLWEQGKPNGDMTLLLSDGRREMGVTADMLRAMFDKIDGTKVLIIDACHAGAMIGKGVHAPFDNVFQGSEYKVICSSGGAEESWFWSGMEEGEAMVGAGYFSGAVVRALSAKGNYGADTNRDGLISLTELKRYLRDNHGASTVYTYPEEDGFAVLSYDAASYTGHRRDSAIEGLSFEGDLLTLLEPTVAFSFTVQRPVQVAYQMVYQQDGRWDFEHGRLLYDNAEMFGTYGDARGVLSPGLKERTVTLDLTDAGSYGYALLQIITQSDGVPTLVSSRALCVPPTSGDPKLTILPQSGFCPSQQEELGFVVEHIYPCELTVTIEDTSGKTVRRLASRMASRPQQLSPRGSTFCWNGLRTNGTPAEPGTYNIRVKAYIGEEVYEALYEGVMLLEPNG